MLVVEQMELIKGRAGNLPMGLFVQIAQRHRIGKQLVQLRGHLQAHRFLKLKRQQVTHSSVGLNFARTLMKTRLCGDLSGVPRVSLLSGHSISPPRRIDFSPMASGSGYLRNPILALP